MPSMPNVFLISKLHYLLMIIIPSVENYMSTLQVNPLSNSPFTGKLLLKIRKSNEQSNTQIRFQFSELKEIISSKKRHVRVSEYSETFCFGNSSNYFLKTEFMWKTWNKRSNHSIKLPADRMVLKVSKNFNDLKKNNILIKFELLRVYKILTIKLIFFTLC